MGWGEGWGGLTTTKRSGVGGVKLQGWKDARLSVMAVFRAGGSSQQL